MGWFDDDDDDGDDEDGKHPPPALVETLQAAAAPPHIGTRDDVNDVDDDDDPLDAYMKTLQKLPSKQLHWTQNDDNDNNDDDVDGDDHNHPHDRSTFLTRRGERLDLDDNDQHYEGNGGPDDDWDKNDDELGDGTKNDSSPFMRPRGAQAIQARHALLSTFRPESTTKVVPSTTKTTDNQLHNKSTTTKSVIDESVSLPPFERQFWTLHQDTVQGREWRRDHSVVCVLAFEDRGKRNVARSNNSLMAHRDGDSNSNAPSPQAMDPIYTMAELQHVLGTSLSRAISSAGFIRPTTIQSQALPCILSGSNVLLTAATGQGKTMAYVWPMLVHVRGQQLLLPDDVTGPLALVLVPTRELAVQVYQQVKPLATAIHCHVKAIVGGQGGKYTLQQDLRHMDGPLHMVIATPGRLLDVTANHKSTTSITTTTSKKQRMGLQLRQYCTYVVLDEADKMLQMGFAPQVNQILGQIRPDRQMIFCSATMSYKIEQVAREWILNTNRNSGIGSAAQVQCYRIAAGRTGQASQQVQQHVMVVPDPTAKQSFLIQMLPTFVQLGRTLVFVATRDSCEQLANDVRLALSQQKQEHPIDPYESDSGLQDIAVVTLHGDKHQQDRVAALRSFQKGSASVLIATDVASRGLDIPHVAVVVNYDAAKNYDIHVHRIGRAGRLDRQSQNVVGGSAYTLLTRKDTDFAATLCQAFERDGVTVAEDLQQLASNSKRYQPQSQQQHNHRKANNKLGLGFDLQSSGVAISSGVSGNHAVPVPSENSGQDRRRSNDSPIGSVSAAQKKSRWG